MHPFSRIAVVAALVATSGVLIGTASAGAATSPLSPRDALRAAHAAELARHPRASHASVAARSTATRSVDAASAPPAGDPFIVTVDDDGDLVWTDTSTRTSGTWDTSALGAFEPSVSRDGAHVAFLYDDGTNAGVAVLTTATGAVSKLTEAADDGPTYDDSPALTADDKDVVFAEISTDSTNPSYVKEVALSDPNSPFDVVAAEDDELATSTLADGSVAYSDGDSSCALYERAAEASESSCVVSPATVEQATGSSDSVIDEIGPGIAGGAVPVVVDTVDSMNGQSTTDVSELAIADVSSGTLTLLPGTRASLNISSITGDELSSPSLDASGTQVIYERDSYTNSSDVSVILSADIATGSHTAVVLPDGEDSGGGGVGSAYPAVEQPAASDFVALATPSRILDTRSGLGAADKPVAAGAPIDLQVTGAGGVPSGASAVVLNVTATQPTRNTDIRVYPTPTSGSAEPTVSNINLLKGATVPNSVTVALPASGMVRIANAVGSVQIIADVTGYYTSDASAAGASLLTTRATPLRVLDTRNGTGAAKAQLGPEGSLDLPLAVSGGPVPTDATAVVLAVGGIARTASTDVAVTPTPAPGTTTVPATSTLNLSPKVPIENLATVGIGSGGSVRFTNHKGDTDVFADLVGYYRPVASGGSAFVPLSPSRIADTRDGTNTVDGASAPVGAKTSKDVRGEGTITTISGSNVVPADATALQVNLTTAGETALTDLAIYATPSGSDTTAGTFSTLDASKGVAIACSAITAVGANGQVRIYNQAGSAHAIVDLAGYFVPATS